MLASWNKRNSAKKKSRPAPLKKGTGKARYTSAKPKAAKSNAAKRDPKNLKAFLQQKRRETKFRRIERAKQRDQRAEQDDEAGDVLAASATVLVPNGTPRGGLRVSAGQ